MDNKKRLIDADEALRMMKNSKHDNPCTDRKLGGVWDIAHDCAISCVEACPAVDAVEVVRCKDCTFKQTPKQYGDLQCQILDVPMKKDDFCSYGERKEYE